MVTTATLKIKPRIPIHAAYNYHYCTFFNKAMITGICKSRSLLARRLFVHIHAIEVLRWLAGRKFAVVIASLYKYRNTYCAKKLQERVQ